ACGNDAPPTELPGPNQMIGSETARENLYPVPGVGPTSFGAQAVPPNVKTRHVKTKAICRTIGCSLYCAHSCRRRLSYPLQQRREPASASFVSCPSSPWISCEGPCDPSISPVFLTLSCWADMVHVLCQCSTRPDALLLWCAASRPAR